MKKQFLALFAGSSLAVIATTAPAMAQATPAPAAAAAAEGPAADQDAAAGKDIVVTGTQIRKVTPAGAVLLTTTAAQAEEQGATNGNEILQQLPQAANVFQNLPSVGGGAGVGIQAASRLSFSAISLRNLPNINTGAGEFTLQLVDGHRIVPIGSDVLGGQGVDASTIPSSLIQRTEIMPDGGSAIYGSNAVAGVINYITRDNFDGLRVTARGGLAKSYWQYDGSITAGKSWATGSVYGSVTYSAHDALFGRDREYIHSWDANPLSPLYQTPLGLSCDAPNIAISSVVNTFNSRRLYPMAGTNGTIQPFTTNGGTNGNGESATNANGIAGGNRCDSTTDDNAYYPKSNSLNMAAGFKQQITDSLVFSLKGMWGKRETTTYSPLTLSATVTATPVLNPNYRPVCNAPVVAPAVQPAGPICGTTPGYFLGDHNRSQTITTNYGSVLPRSLNSFITLKSWQLTPQLSWDFASDWQARAFLSYGESMDEGIDGALNTALQNTRIASGLINPYNLPASGAGAFQDLITYGYREGNFTLLDIRLVADGPLPLIHLPGGDIRVAVGAEYTRTKGRNQIIGLTRSSTPSNFNIATDLSYTQSVKSVFAEAQVPLVSEAMDIPLVNSLNISGSARYDYYNDVKGTFNTMAGLTWGLTPWLRARGNYNTSFAAPSNLAKIASALGAIPSTVNTNGGGGVLAYFTGFIPPGGANGGQAGTSSQGATGQTNPIGIAVSMANGSVKDIGPQTSRTWSAGIEIEPPFIPGLTLGASYYNLRIAGAIGSPFQPNAQSVFDFHPELVFCHGGINGSAPNAPAACAVPMSIAELEAGGYIVAADPTNPNSPGLAQAATLGVGGISGGFGTITWPQIRASYCGPAGAPGPAGTFTPGAPNNGCAAVAGTGTTNTYTVFHVLDNRSRNLGFVFAKGIDFTATYRTNVPWGTVDARVTGTVNLTTATQPQAGATVVDVQEFGTSVFRLSGNLGTTWGALRAQVTWQHTQGYNLTVTATGTPGTATFPGTGAYGQSHVGDYDTFDLFFRLSLDKLSSGPAFRDLAVTLNVNNFLNRTPPRQGGGTANGTTLGRLWQLGISKDF